MSVAGLLSEDDLRPPKHGQRWGNWTYNGPNLTHQHPYYEVDLEWCVDAESVLGWMFQVADKSWSTTDDIGHLFLALGRTIGYRLRWGELNGLHQRSCWGEEVTPVASGVNCFLSIDNQFNRCTLIDG